MAKVDLSSSEWCDLIFSGKNKAYGAYQLREKSPKRHNIAVILVIVIALVGFSIPTLIKMATPKQKEVMTEVTTLSQLEEPEIKQEEMKRVEPVAPPPPALKSSIKFTAPVIKKDEEVRDEDEIKSQHELAETKVTISIADVKGNDEEHGKDIADLKQVVTQAEPEPEKVFDMVEQMPQFPGGQTASVIWSYIIRSCLPAVLILFFRDQKIRAQWFQYMLIWSGRMWIPNCNLFSTGNSTHTVRNDTVCCKITASDHITGTRS